MISSGRTSSEQPVAKHSRAHPVELDSGGQIPPKDFLNWDDLLAQAGDLPVT